MSRLSLTPSDNKLGRGVSLCFYVEDKSIYTPNNNEHSHKKWG